MATPGGKRSVRLRPETKEKRTSDRQYQPIMAMDLALGWSGSLPGPFRVIGVVCQSDCECSMARTRPLDHYWNETAESLLFRYQSQH